MRVLALTERFPRPWNSRQAPFNKCQLVAVSKHHEVKAVVPVLWTEYCKARFTRMNIPRCHMSDGIEIFHPIYYYTPFLWRSRYGEQYYHSVRSLVLEIAERFRPDIIYSCWAHPDGWAAWRLARELGIACVVRVMGSDVLLNVRNEARRRRIREVLCNVEGVITGSYALRTHVTGLGVDGSRVHVVYNGIDPHVFSRGDRKEARTSIGIPDGQRLLVSVGNLVPVKGHAVLIDACRLLKANNLIGDFTCRIIGHGPLHSSLKKRAAEYGLERHVLFEGSQPQQVLATWYRAADTVVLPSHSEGMPNVLLEARACGAPFVASNVGGIAEIADEGGLLVDPGHPEQLAHAIVQQLTSKTTSSPSYERTHQIAADELTNCFQSAMDRYRQPLSHQIAFR